MKTGGRRRIAIKEDLVGGRQCRHVESSFGPTCLHKKKMAWQEAQPKKRVFSHLEDSTFRGGLGVRKFCGFRFWGLNSFRSSPWFSSSWSKGPFAVLPISKFYRGGFGIRGLDLGGVLKKTGCRRRNAIKEDLDGGRSQEEWYGNTASMRNSFLKLMCQRKLRPCWWAPVQGPTRLLVNRFLLCKQGTGSTCHSTSCWWPSLRDRR